MIKITDAGDQVRIETDQDNIEFVNKQGLVVSGQAGLLKLIDSSLNERVSASFQDVQEPLTPSLSDLVTAVRNIIESSDPTISEKTVQTIGAVTATINTITLQEGDRVMIQTDTIASQSDESARNTYVQRSFFYRNVGGDVTKQGATGDAYVIESEALWDVTHDADVTNQTIDVNVTGAAGDTVNWKTRTRIVRLND